MTQSCCAVKPQPVKPWRLYRPLLIVLGVSVTLSAINVIGDLVMTGAPGGALGFGWSTVMPFANGAMGLFMLMIGGLQARHPTGFADLFAAYDPLARRWRAYGLAYPFLTMALGIGYWLGVWPAAINLCTLLIMTASATGIARVLRSGEKLRCACAGMANELPIGWVSLAEYGSMAAMAALNLLWFVA